MKSVSFKQIFSQSLLLLFVAALTTITTPTFGDVPEVLFFGSDVHDDITSLNIRLNNCDDSYPYPYELVGLCGDYCTYSYISVQDAITFYNPAAIQVLTQGNNESYYTHPTGPVTGLTDNEFYDIYVINWGDTMADAFTNYVSINAGLNSYLSSYNNGKVIFVLSHAPLHSSRYDIDQLGAEVIFNTLQAYGDYLDIVFLWGHNHSSPSYDVCVNKTALPGETICDGVNPNCNCTNPDNLDNLNDNAYAELKFTSLNAGYISADNAATTITVDSSEININRCATPLASAVVPRKPGSSTVILLDRSGSMSWSPDGDKNALPEEQRITLAQKTITAFIELMEDYNDPNLKFGIVQFPQHPPPAFWADCEGQVLNNLAPFTPAYQSDAIVTINDIEAAGNTPLLDGVSKAAGLFDIEPNRTVVLLSDGHHNCPVPVSVGDAALDDLINELKKKSVHVFCVGFGESADPDNLLLSALADETTPTGGTSQFFNVTTSDDYQNDSPYDWDPSTALDAVYTTILADILHLEKAVDPIGIIRGGDKISRDIRISRLDTRISFFVSWKTQRSKRLAVSVLSSDGFPVPFKEKGIKLHEGNTYFIMTVDKAYLSRPGKIGPTPWKLIIDAGSLKQREYENYQYSVIMNSMLKMKAGFDKKTYRTGERMILSAELTQGRKYEPVKNLREVWVEISRPADGIENWLSVNKAGTRTPLKLQLFDNGSNGDKIAGDGIYSNIFRDTVSEGVYSFSFKASGFAGREPFERHHVMQKYISVAVDPGQTRR